MNINFLRKEKSFTKRKESLWLDVILYWRLAILFMFIVALLSAFLGYYLFKQINKEIVVDEKDTSGAIFSKKERLDKVLDYFSARQKKSDQILNSSAPVIDPSL